MAPLELMRIAAGSLVAAAWEGLVLAGVVAVCLRILPGITAAARSVVWTVVMLAVVGLPFLHFGTRAAGSVAGPQVHLDERVGLGLVVVWALISLVRAAQLMRSAIWLRGISRRALAVDGGVARSVMGGARQAALCVSEEVDRPCVVGFFKPRVLIPTALFEQLSDAELAQIVMHEMEHLRRRDDWTNLLQKLSLVVFPLNPALIWIERQLCVERELACDDQVLKATGARKAYAACLANLAEHSMVRRGVSLALGAWERQSEVVRRVHRILAGTRNEMGRRQAAGVVAVLMVGVIGAADGLAHAPALVSFGPARMEVAAVRGAGVKTPLYAGAQFVGINPHANPGMPVRATDVVFHPAAPVKARHAVAAQMNAPVVEPVKRASVEVPRFRHSAEDEPMVVMVTWQMAAPVIVQDSQFTYAAVPTRNGWLFVQL